MTKPRAPRPGFVLDNFVIIPYEERSVERALGDAYLAYKARVRRWL